MSFNLYEEITSRIIAQLENGVIPWEQPWVDGAGAWSRATGKNYSLLNQMLLPRGEYATIKQINEAGGKVNKGAAAKQVVFWKMLKTTETIDGEEVEKTIPMLRYYNVFNVETDTNLEIKHKKFVAQGQKNKIDKMEQIKDDYVAKSGVSFTACDSSRAYYTPTKDAVIVPRIEQFQSVAEYYSTLFHELAHSTGHESRLNRFVAKTVAFGDEDYSREELVAELTACSILANNGVETDASFRNNSAYIGGWLKALKDDNKALVWASSRAEKAYNLIMNGEDDK